MIIECDKGRWAINIYMVKKYIFRVKIGK